MFVDEVHIHVQGGHGGPGIVAWHREKFVAFGGPSGGDGGHGASVILEADENLSTLMDLRYQHHIRGPKGASGGIKQMTGASGEDKVLAVPVGTQIFDVELEELLADLTEHGQRFVAARGGRGGLGNAHFLTSTNRSPRHCQPGEPGDERKLRLELKLLAEVGIIGYPSVGKSTLIAAISNARPKIASYPFTTLVPNLGMVKWKGDSFAVADIPGLIEGAHEGLGLGHQFLRHVERCRTLIHIIEVPPPFEYQDGSTDWTEREPIEDFRRICRELELFNPELADRDQTVVLNKVDQDWTAAEVDRLRAHFEGEGYGFIAISAVARQGLDALLDKVGPRVLESRARANEELARLRRAKRGEGVDALLDLKVDEVLDEAVQRGEGASGFGRHTERVSEAEEP